MRGNNFLPQNHGAYYMSRILDKKRTILNKIIMFFLTSMSNLIFMLVSPLTMLKDCYKLIYNLSKENNQNSKLKEYYNYYRNSAIIMSLIYFCGALLSAYFGVLYIIEATHASHLLTFLVSINPTLVIFTWLCIAVHCCRILHTLFLIYIYHHNPTFEVQWQKEVENSNYYLALLAISLVLMLANPYILPIAIAAILVISLSLYLVQHYYFASIVTESQDTMKTTDTNSEKSEQELQMKTITCQPTGQVTENNKKSEPSTPPQNLEKLVITPNIKKNITTQLQQPKNTNKANSLYTD